ncbi:MAG: hypothetical protein JO276_10645 [Sphingomonadaceae bacterium]|nr:hypothetical protein [Sphingomonadaceae bacterium]
MRAIAAAIALSILLAGCDRSEPFALRDGCYYAESGKPILRVRGEDGIILTPEPAPSPNHFTPVHRVHLSARANRDGAYLDVAPGFFLTDDDAAATSSPTSRFAIDTRVTPPVIMVNMVAWGEEPIYLGGPC